MKNFKKFLTLVLAVMMVVSSFAFSTSAATTKFEDIDAKNEALVEAVDLLAYMGIAKGKSETNFGADELVTREQFALFMYRLVKGEDAPKGANSTKFTDLEDPTYFYAISWAAAKGIVNGKSATTFAPKDSIKLQEAYAMIVRALDWEKENDLVYPFGHIEVAEQKGVELDKELDSDIGYTDELTRGDMAILLYNAFFAETGIEETKTYIRATTVEEQEATNYIFVEETVNPVFCVKYYDAIEVDYQAIATPNRRVGDINGDGAALLNEWDVGEQEATYDLGYDAIFFDKVSYDPINLEKVAPEQTYIAAEELRDVDADKLDDYFLGVFKMYVTVDEDDELEKVLFADCNMTKKTVSDLTFGTVSSNKEESYYHMNGDRTESKLLSGKVTADGEDIYVFNAPYSYLKPTYNGCVDAYDKYGARNSDNLVAIDYILDDEAEDDDEIVIIAESGDLVSYPVSNTDGDDVADKYFADQAYELAEAFETAYYGGLHEADLYDVDGDGRYEYINYKPYAFFQVDSDKDEEFGESDFPFDGLDEDHDFPYIYTNEAKFVLGEEFADEDFVIGYFSEEMETVYVHAVVKPTIDTLDSYRQSKGTITLGNGDVVDVTGAYKLLANIQPLEEVVYDVEYVPYFGVDFDAEAQFDYQIRACELFDNDLIDDEYEFYIYDGVLLAYGDVDSNFKFTENLIIPTDLYYEYSFDADEDGEIADDGSEDYTTAQMVFDNDDEIVREPEEAFDAEAGKVWYIYAWVDGKTRYVPVVTEDVEPNLIDNNGQIAPEYLNKLCTYSVDEDGVYTIKSLGYDVDDDDVDVYEGVNRDGLWIDANDNGEYDDGEELYENFDEFEGLAALDNKKKEDLQYYVDDQAGTITKVAGSRFEIPGFDRSVDLKAYTKIIIRVFDVEEQEFTYSVFDASTFKKSLDNGALTNVSYIVSNNPGSKNRENLVVLYAETTDITFKGETNKQNVRIVSDVRSEDDEDGLWRFYYDLYNPYTGEKVYDVPSVNGEKKASMLDDADAFARGDIIKLYDGLVDEDKGNTVVGTDALVYITEVDEAEGFFAVAKYNDVTNNGTETCKECIDENVENFDVDAVNVVDFVNTYKTGANKGEPKVITMGDTEVPTNYIAYNKNTVVSVMTRDYRFEEINHWADGKMALSSIEAIADADKSLLCYNKDAKDRNGKLKTGYADYVKAYVSVVDENLEEDELPTADFIIVIVNAEEAAALDVDCPAHD